MLPERRHRALLRVGSRPHKVGADETAVYCGICRAAARQIPQLSSTVWRQYPGTYLPKRQECAQFIGRESYKGATTKFCLGVADLWATKPTCPKIHFLLGFRSLYFENVGLLTSRTHVPHRDAPRIFSRERRAEFFSNKLSFIWKHRRVERGTITALVVWPVGIFVTPYAISYTYNLPHALCTTYLSLFLLLLNDHFLLRH